MAEIRSAKTVAGLGECVSGSVCHEDDGGSGLENLQAKAIVERKDLLSDKLSVQLRVGVEKQRVQYLGLTGVCGFTLRCFGCLGLRTSEAANGPPRERSPQMQRIDGMPSRGHEGC